MTDSEQSDTERHNSAFGDPAWWISLLQIGFGRSFWGFLAFALITGLACYLIMGGPAVIEALNQDVELILRMVPRVLVALAIAGLLWVMLPRDKVTSLIGTESGYRGLIIAAFAGMITPGGPTSAFALLAVLAASGGDRGTLIAYISSWSILGLQRVLVWDIPFMGAEFSILRFLVCVPLPIIAGMIARRLPFTLEISNVQQNAGR